VAVPPDSSAVTLTPATLRLLASEIPTWPTPEVPTMVAAKDNPSMVAVN
jgi:hypothetical protein